MPSFLQLARQTHVTQRYEGSRRAATRDLADHVGARVAEEEVVVGKASLATNKEFGLAVVRLKFGWSGSIRASDRKWFSLSFSRSLVS